MQCQRLPSRVEDFVVQIEIAHAVKGDDKVRLRQAVLDLVPDVGIRIAEVRQDLARGFWVVATKERAQRQGQVGFTGAVTGDCHDEGALVFLKAKQPVSNQSRERTRVDELG